MKLSLERKWGYAQIRGGRVLKVVHEHPVSTEGYNPRVDGETNPLTGEAPKPAGTEKWRTARVGDLAVEVVMVKTGKVWGLVYLTGPAINIWRTHPWLNDWFVAADYRYIDLTKIETREAAFTACSMMGCAGTECDLIGFELTTKGDAIEAMKYINGTVRYRPERYHDAPLTADLMGLVRDGTKKHGRTLAAHWQCQDHHSDGYSAGVMEIGVLLTARATPIDLDVDAVVKRSQSRPLLDPPEQTAAVVP